MFLGVVAIALAFGLSIVAGAYAIGHISGCHVNPARSLAPAIFTGGEALAQFWVFILAPLIGAALAAIVFKSFFAVKEES